MRREKFIIQPGKICTFDAKNRLKKDVDSIIHVEVVKRVKYRPFGKSIWTVKATMGDELYLRSPGCFNVYEYLLSPIGVTVIRNPSDFPEVSEKDIKLLDELIYYFEHPPVSYYENVKTNYLTIKPESLERLKAFREKIVHAITLRDV